MGKRVFLFCFKKRCLCRTNCGNNADPSRNGLCHDRWLTSCLWFICRPVSTANLCPYGNFKAIGRGACSHGFSFGSSRPGCALFKYSRSLYCFSYFSRLVYGRNSAAFRGSQIRLSSELFI